MKTNIAYSMLAALCLVCLIFPLRAVAVLPPPAPDGGYGDANTAEVPAKPPVTGSGKTRIRRSGIWSAKYPGHSRIDDLRRHSLISARIELARDVSSRQLLSNSETGELPNEKRTKSIKRSVYREGTRSGC